MHRRIILALLLLMAAGVFHSALACSCLEPGPPCAAMGTSDGIFLGRVVNITSFTVPRPPSIDGDFFDIGDRSFLRVRFNVESPFKGVAAGTVEIITSADSGGGCGYPFEVDGRYVVYASRGNNNALETSLCSRTSRVENASEDLTFFRDFAAASPLARIYGQLGFLEPVPLLSPPRPGPLPGVRVVIEGSGGPKETVTDKQGRYEIRGLSEGMYVVTPQPQSGSLMKFTPPSMTVNVVERGCAEANAFADVHGQISGRITNADGAPVPEQLVQLLPESISPREARLWSLPTAVTNEDGTYVIENVPPGRYLVGIAVTSPPQTFAPDRVVYPRLYFPSATARAEARVIELAAGAEQRGIDMVLPKPLRKREIRGVVEFRDGTRAKDARVVLSNTEYEAVHDNFTETDAKGVFSFDTFEGQTFEIRAFTSNDRDGNRMRGELTSLKTPVDRDQIVITLPNPATLKGRLVDSHETPQANIEVQLILEETVGWEAAFKQPYEMRARSDSQGRFEIQGLAPQRYVLAIHASSPPRQYETVEYPPAFYPGTPDRRMAEVIVAKEGQDIELSNFVLPESLVQKQIQGMAVWPDGSPVQEAYFRVEDLDFPGWTDVASGPVSREGRFEVPLFVGRRYVIRSASLKDQEGRRSLWTLESKPVEILVSPDSKDLRLQMTTEGSIEH